MKIRVLRAFSAYRPGQIFDWADGMARLLIGRGLIEEAREKRAVEVEQAVLESPVERAELKMRRKQK